MTEAPRSSSVPVDRVRPDDILTRDLELTPPSGRGHAVYHQRRSDGHTSAHGACECTDAPRTTGGSLVAEGRMCFEQSRAGEPESEAECEEHAGRNINYSAAAPLVLSSCASQEVTH